MTLPFQGFSPTLLIEAVHTACRHFPQYAAEVTLMTDGDAWRGQWAEGERSSMGASVTISLAQPAGTVTLQLGTDSTAEVASAVQQLAAVIERELLGMQRHAALQTSHDQLQAMVQATPLALYSLSLEGLVRSWSRLASGPHGHAAGHVVHDPALEGAFALLRRSILAGQPGNVQLFDRPLADGSVQTIELRAAPFATDACGQVELIGVAQDVTHTEQRLAEIEEQRTLLESVLAFANDSVLITEAEPIDAPGPRILYANEAFTRTTGYTLEDVLGKTPRVLQGPRTDRKALDKIRAALKAWKPVEVELVNYRKDGTEFWVELSISPVSNKDGWFTHWISVQRDITDRKTSAFHLEQARNQVLELAARNVPLEEVLSCLLQSVEAEFPAFQAAVILVADTPVVYLPAHPASWAQPSALRRLLMNTARVRVALGSTDGGPGWWGWTQRLHDSQGQHRGVLVLSSQSAAPLQAEDWERLASASQLAALVIARYDAQANLERQALHDPLTGLPNRLQFGQALEQALLHTRQTRTQVAVGLMDLNRFKLINDTLGHSAGDLLLQQVAARLRENLRPGDLLARMGGDEFLLAFLDLPDVQRIEPLANRVLLALEQPFTLSGQEVFVRPSLGFSVFPLGAFTPEALLQQADTAMYRAKQRGGGFSVYSQEGDDPSSSFTLESALNRALQRGEFVLHYQPQFDTATGTLQGMEALLRWQHPEFGLVPPSDFIPLAEVTGLIVPIGAWVLEQAAHQAVLWSSLIPGLTMAVNLSVRQFEQPALIAEVASVLHRTGLPAAQLELELTESMLMQAVEAKEALGRLKALGVRIAVDDFGTGYSNLAYLKHFPIDRLKIDQAFIQGLAEPAPTDVRDAALVSAVIQLASALGLSVTVEGVEHPAQLAFLRAHGCDQVQGYLMGRPQPADVLTTWLLTKVEETAATRF